jgi:hypothetical protein
VRKREISTAADQEPSKLSGAVALMETRRCFLGIQRGEEPGRPVPRVAVGPALDLPRPHRQHGLRAIERLDLGLFVDAQHQCFVRRIRIEPDDVADFVDEQRIFGQLEGFAPMRLQPNVRQIRLTAVWLSPLRFAMARVLQCVASRGVRSKVSAITRSTSTSVILRGALGGGSSSSPCNRSGRSDAASAPLFAA